MKKVLTSIVFVFGFAAVGFGAVDDAEAPPAEHSATESQRQKIYKTYKMCSDAALVRPLGKDEVLWCNVAYLQLKLTFVEGVTLEDYSRLSAAARARVNRSAYDSYRRWVEQRASWVCASTKEKGRRKRRPFVSGRNWFYS